MRLPIYLDHNATTPVDPGVLEEMLPCFHAEFGNPASRTHAWGWRADRRVVQARERIARAIGARVGEIILTSGATEANNLAILGIADRHHERPGEIITGLTEHKAVLDPCRHLERRGWTIHRLPPDAEGRVDPDVLRRRVGPRTALISLMAANNETGALHPWRELGAVARELGVPFHIDAAQAVGKVPFDVESAGADLVSISGHKLYGPPGVGALFVRGRPRVGLSPILFGGGHEQGLRPGTVPMPLAVGLGAAIERAVEGMAVEAERARGLIDRLRRALRSEVPDLLEFGVDRDRHPERTLPGTLLFGFPGLESQTLMVALPELALSNGSACTSTELTPSHVLRAMGVAEDRAHTAIRIGVGRSTRPEEIDHAARLLAGAARRLRAGSGS
jgi:cysteine desulfurase